MKRKQLVSEKRVWSTHIYNKMFNNEPPVPFAKSSEIIETVHLMMMEHLFEHRRPIELKRSIGYLEFKKCIIRGPLFISSFPLAKEKNKSVHKVINYLTGGKTYSIRFQFSRYGNFRLYKFKALKKHRTLLRELIINKDVQEF
jgi:hypothetical protein